MTLTVPQLIKELSTIVEPSLALAAVESYVEMQQRFLAGDWKPAELDGGRLCEAIAQCVHQLDTGSVTHSKLPGKICERLNDENLAVAHNLNVKDRHHIAKVIEVVYKFRSDRGPVHISPTYTANEMDSVFVLHAGKWIFAEFLRLTWNKDRQVIAETISRIVQLEHSLIHELDGEPLVLALGITAKEEVLLLLNHAPGNRLSRETLRYQAAGQKPNNVNVAITRLIKEKEIRPVGGEEVALTPLGQIRIIQEIIPKWNPYRSS
jgi:hypothetical protein